MGIIGLIQKAGMKTSHLNQKIRGFNWSEMSRGSFVSALSGTIKELEEIKLVLKTIGRELEEQGSSKNDEVSIFLEEYGEKQKVLERSLELEQSKKKSLLLEKELVMQGYAESFADTERKTLDLLLKTTYFLQKLQLELHSIENQKSNSFGQEDLLTLLQSREEEIKQLRNKNEFASKSLIGKTGLTSAELEETTNELSRKLETVSTLMEKELKEFEKKFDEIQSYYAGIREKSGQLHETAIIFLKEASELMTLLKNERDQARKTLLEIEQETLGLRQKYSLELLNYNQAKNKIRRELLEEFNSRTMKLEKELEEKSSLLSHFRAIAEDKEKQLSALEEKISELTAKLGIKQKHDSMKKKFGK